MYPNNLPNPQQPPNILSQTQPPAPHVLPPLHPAPAMEVAPGRKRTKKNRACDLCRRKKIRCDYDQAYPQSSCTSCLSYDKTCTFQEAAKRRGPPKGYVEGLENRLKRMEKLLMDIASQGKLPADKLKAVLDGTNEEETDEESHTSHSDDTSAHQTSKEHTPEETDRALIESPQQSNPTINAIKNEDKEDKTLSYMGSSSGIYLLNRLFHKDQKLQNNEKKSLTRPVGGHEEDLMIARHSCDPMNKLDFGRILNPDWKIPAKDLRDHLIKIYFERINPMMPILDEDLFYEEYRKANHAPTFIPVMMAVFRATSRILDENDPLLAKYNTTRSDLFRDLCKQLQLFFDLDFLEPKIETIQVLLLNVSNPERWGIHSTDWIGTSVAVKMAQDLGLHRANAQEEGMPKKVIAVKKRIWWSAYIIDRWVCAALGRPLTISDADCDLEYPELQDAKYTVFVCLVRLSCILGDVLRGLCSPRARLMSQKGLGLENLSRSLEQMLLEWKSTLPADLNMTEEELSRISRKELDPALERKLNNGAGILQLAFDTVYMLSKRPFISMDLGSGSTLKIPGECQKAIKRSVDIFETIDVSCLLCGWCLSSLCISHYSMLLFLNYKSVGTDSMDESVALLSRYKERHHELAKHITEPSIVPFMDRLTKVIGGYYNGPLKPNQQHPSNRESIMEHQSALWEASNGLDWEEMFKFLAETGYKA